jgi:hypothetical protein
MMANVLATIRSRGRLPQLNAESGAQGCVFGHIQRGQRCPCSAFEEQICERWVSGKHGAVEIRCDHGGGEDSLPSRPAAWIRTVAGPYPYARQRPDTGTEDRVAAVVFETGQRRESQRQVWIGE